MFKKIVGIRFTLATWLVIVACVVNRDNVRSMVSDNWWDLFTTSAPAGIVES